MNRSSLDISKTNHLGRPILVEWEIETYYTEPQTMVVMGNNGKKIDSYVVHSPEQRKYSYGHNLVVNTGRTQLLSLAFVPSASSIGGFYYLGVGASATAAAVTDTRLTYELIGNATRKTLTNTNGNQPTSADIQLETITVSGCTFYEKIVLQATYTTGDGNNNNTFNEYGVFTSATLPVSPTGTSGTMFNHYIDSNPAFKASTNQVQIAVTIRM